jgi:hypothetical protein
VGPAASLDLYPHATSNEVVRSLYRSLAERHQPRAGRERRHHASTVPLGFEGGSWTTITVDGYQPAHDERVSAGYNLVGPDYFRTLQTSDPSADGMSARQTTSGRARRGRQRGDGEAVLAWPRGARQPDPLLGREVDAVVGVVANTKQKELNDWNRPYFYVPMLQFSRRDDHASCADHRRCRLAVGHRCATPSSRVDRVPGRSTTSAPLPTTPALRHFATHAAHC